MATVLETDALTKAIKGEHPDFSGMPLKESYTQEFIELKRRMKEAGIFDKQPVYYAIKFTEVLLMFAISIYVLYQFPNRLWIQILNAVWMGIAATHSGYIMHDAGHREIFRDAKRNNWIGWVYANLLLGSANGWWIPYHNEHHANPNEAHTDPAIDLPFWAFEVDEAKTKSGIMKWAVINQAWLYFPLMLFQAFFLRIRTAVFFATEQIPNKGVEIFFILLHLVWYVAVIFTTQSLWVGLAFVVVQHAVAGVYLGAAFAPNHKGMPVIEEGADIDFMI